MCGTGGTRSPALPPAIRRREGVRVMAQVQLELEGLDEINAKVEELYSKIREVIHTADELSQKTIALRVKINQPPAGTDD